MDGESDKLEIDDLPYEGWTNWHTWHVVLLLDNIYEYYEDYWKYMRKNSGFRSVDEVRAYVSGLFESKISKERYDEDIDFNKACWQEILEALNSKYLEEMMGAEEWLKIKEHTIPSGLEQIELSWDISLTSESRRNT